MRFARLRHSLRTSITTDSPRTLITSSGLFDPDWYRAHLPETERDTPDLLTHFLTEGTLRRLAPGPMFDPDAYFGRYWQLEPGADNALLAYLQDGMAHGHVAQGVCDRGVRGGFGPVEPTLLSPPPPQVPSVAVLVHATHEERFEEIVRDLRLAPHPFTLLITTDTPERAARMRQIAAASPLRTTLFIRHAPFPDGRYWPSVTVFREALRCHDLILRLHTGYADTEQTEWNAGLMQDLLPVSGGIGGILTRFAQDPGLGLLQPAPDPAVSYRNYTWQGLRHTVQPLLAHLGIAAPDGYIDHPLGGMFWARTAALAPLLDAPWHDPDFAPTASDEAVDRCIGLLAQARGYRTDEHDSASGLIRVGWGQKNLDQYEIISDNMLREAIAQARTVSFDLFDTLLTRIALAPDAVHHYVAHLLSRAFPDAAPPTADFFRLRKQAEHQAREALFFTDDVDLDAIYATLARMTDWPETVLAMARKLEVDIDQRILRPRDDLIGAARYARAQGRRVILISDTYLDRAELQPVLEKTGILPLLDEIYISNERLARKDRGDLWDLVCAAEGADGLLHVGDNEQADIQQAAAHGVRFFHVMSGLNMLRLNPLGPHVRAALAADPHTTPQAATLRRLGGDILLGPLVSELFSSPFATPPCGNRTESGLGAPCILDTPERAGEILFGPLLLCFMAKLIYHPGLEGLERLHFLAREGYFLEKLYREIRETCFPHLPEPVYFHCSRRVAICAAQAVQFDPDVLVRSGENFRGSFAALLEGRLGLRIERNSPLHSLMVSTASDSDSIRAMTLLLRDEIQSHAETIRNDLDAYARSTGLVPGLARRQAVVDVGYSATIQRHLQTALDMRLAGFYMAAEERSTAVEKTGGVALGLLAHGAAAKDFQHQFCLAVEAFLTAPHGQTIGYDLSGATPAPLFAPGGRSQEYFPTLQRMFDGVLKYSRDILSSYGPDCLTALFDATPAATAALYAFGKGDITLAPDITAALWLEDSFCGQGEVSITRQGG